VNDLNDDDDDDSFEVAEVSEETMISDQPNSLTDKQCRLKIEQD
jgi:hypothetical protein